MSKKIAILRGINVGGKRKILMADLRQLLTDIGFLDVSTYIQSGNVFFNTEEELSNIEIGDKIQQAIADKYGFVVPVIVRTREEVEAAIQNNPFNKDDVDIKHLCLTFLREIPSEEARKKTETYNYEPDKFDIQGKDVFIYIEGKYHQSKVSNNFLESKLKVSATTRNWKTVLKLLELSK